jgi:hypothetical protein
VRTFSRSFLDALPKGALLGLALALVWLLYDVVVSGASWKGAVAAGALSWASCTLLYAFLTAFVRPDEP